MPIPDKQLEKECRRMAKEFRVMQEALQGQHVFTHQHPETVSTLLLVRELRAVRREAPDAD